MRKHFTNKISEYFGKFAKKEFNKNFQGIVNSSYVKLMGLDMNEFDKAKSYISLNKLFTRALKSTRDIENDDKAFISPCDSLVMECGKLQEYESMQIKGMSYHVGEFLGDEIEFSNIKKVENGEYINLYLSPKDYHRYHAPLDMKISRIVHIPGKLYPVNKPALKNKKNLFIENERVVLQCHSTDGKLFYLVMVGALNVGQIVINAQPNLHTNADVTQPTVYDYEDLNIKKGDELGYFMMGSTVIVISEKDMLKIDVQAHENVRFGQKIATIA